MIKLNGKEVIFERFPNGETLIKTEGFENDLSWISRNRKDIITVKFEDDRDIARLIFLKGYLDDNKRGGEKVLIIPYLPYSRMDRTEGMTVFTLKYLCKLINSLNFDRVVVSEVHSDVSMALLDRAEFLNTTKDILEGLVKDNEVVLDDDTYIVFPDAGAAKRYGKQIKHDRILVANKTRDFATGKITGLTIQGELKEGSKCIVVDDLCSYGGTFMFTAKKLKEMGAGDVQLIVAHCENSIFYGDILKTDLISKIYTSNSILNQEHEKIRIVFNI